MEALKIELKAGLKVRLKKWIAKICGLSYHQDIREPGTFEVPPMPVNHGKLNRIRFEKIVPEEQRFTIQQNIKSQIINEVVQECIEKGYLELKFRKVDQGVLAELEFYVKKR